MYTKSLIQLQLEKEELMESFYEDLKELVNKYNIEENVFAIGPRGTEEVTEGYFVEDKIYDDLYEAVKASNGIIKINNSKRFTTGRLVETLTECDMEADVFDVYSMKYVQE